MVQKYFECARRRRFCNYDLEWAIAIRECAIVISLFGECPDSYVHTYLRIRADEEKNPSDQNYRKRLLFGAVEILMAFFFERIILG